MITESYSKMATEVGMRPVRDGADEFRDELETMLREEQRKHANDVENELSIFRSGSVPPTVEGSFSALFGGGGGSEEEFRSDPAYAQYYRSNVNLNPRLPPPLDWRLGEKVGVGGGGFPAVGDRSKVIGRIGKKEENVVDSRTEWDGDGLIGLRQKSFAEIIQDDVNQAYSQAYDNILDPEFRNLEQLTPAESFYSGLNSQGMSALQKIESAAAQNYASAFGASLSRSSTPDPQHIAKAPSPRIPPVGGGRPLDRRNSSILKTSTDNLLSVDVPTELDSAFSGMSLSANTMLDDGRLSPFQTHPESFYDDLENTQNNGKLRSLSNGSGSVQYHNSLQPSAESYFKGSSLLTGGNSPSRYSGIDSPNSPFPNYGMAGAVNTRSPFLGNQLGGGNLSPFLDDIASARAMGVDPRMLAGGLTSGLNSLALASELASLRRFVNQGSGSAQQMPPVDPLYLQYLRSSEYVARYSAAMNDPMFDRESHGNAFAELLEMHKSYLETLLSHYKSQYGLPYHGKPNNFDGYYGNTGHGLGMGHTGSSFAAQFLPNSPVGISNPLRHGERSMRFPSGMHNFNGSIPGSWNMDLGDNFGLSMLDQFKGNKSKSFELSEIAGHVVEFSADQYGSRFIQQKLETATPSERDMVYNEIMPLALTLMTDVFGNYVIQKFFEHGTPAQIRELAEQLTGHVLALSLQMYGCRVIQKAIEIIDLDQQKKMVVELDGHVIRCVRDQNGNHVIQKCIECVPEDAIQFIVETFFTQVVALSTHPYGCRVIQRVLEHCHDPKTQSIVMGEIMQCVCVLAQDQYGNYVVQHVIEHGKPEERTLIISQLTEQIVQMSQQKFASNVVEKCLAFGTPEERQTLVNEMLGTSDENEPLQAMMKDQFANYVVQKVLETCDDQQLELILGRIKVHLNALKKYTYGKHIVARVEKLVATGEKRIGTMSSNPSAAA